MPEAELTEADTPPHEVPYSSPEAETRLGLVVDAARHDVRAGRGSNPPGFPAAARLVYWLAWSDESLRVQIEAAHAAIPDDIAPRRKGETDEKTVAERVAAFAADIVRRLKDPNAVHANLLTHAIARPTPAQIVHVYGGTVLLAAILTPAEQAVIDERRRQVMEEGWTPEHDDEHRNGQMAVAAACYALHGTDEPHFAYHPVQVGVEQNRRIRNRAAYSAVTRDVPNLWPWSESWWKPKDRRRDLERAAALIVAEIERLARAEGTAK